MNLRWFVSRTVRHATHMWKHVRNILNAQRDLLTAQAIENMEEALGELRTASRSRATKAELEAQMKKLEETANKWLKPYPNSSYRENVEVFLVALAVAMGIRTFFVQPFKIPTGSMQPTLFGVTSENLLDKPDAIPTGLARVREWFEGISYIDIKAKADGEVTRINAPVGVRVFNFYQNFQIGGVNHTILFPPDYGAPPPGNVERASGLSAGTFELRAGLIPGKVYQKGESVVRLRVQAGDHLFVDRFTYNFRKPQRGEIAVFQTAGIAMLPQDQFYIKRLVALGGETVSIGNDRHLRINGDRLDKATPHFENVYSFDPAEPPRDSHFSGHVNNYVAMQTYGSGRLSPLFENENETRTISKDHYMVMGDNTMNSLDSRTWGEFAGTNIIGKQFFVYWPLTKRFGWGNK